MKYRFIFAAILFCTVLVFCAGCIEEPKSDSSPALDYANKENWAKLPVPNQSQKEVDVFYIYPTLFQMMYLDSMNISDPELREGAVADVLMKEGIFLEHANIYAPMYRQTGLFSMISDGVWTEDQYLAEKVAYEDVRAAFLYYMENYNKGKPFILAGHSQGSYRIKQLMIDLFVNETLQNQLVVAYPIGYTFSEFELAQHPHLKAATRDNDTGVFVTFHVQSPETYGENMLVMPGGVGINPLNWKTDDTVAPKELNKGAVFVYPNGSTQLKVSNFTSAYLDTSGKAAVLIVKEPSIAEYPAGPEFLAPGVFHIYEYYFFYENLRENVGTRIDAYLAAA